MLNQWMRNQWMLNQWMLNQWTLQIARLAGHGNLLGTATCWAWQLAGHRRFLGHEDGGKLHSPLVSRIAMAGLMIESFSPLLLYALQLCSAVA
jgi:hypothetical protein